MKKKPDQVVFNEKTKTYDAALKPYGTNVGAPAIQMSNTAVWKNRNIHKANKIIETKYLELKAEYDKMMAEYEYNNLIYNSRFSFEPLIGETYHLYKDKKEQTFLSLIAPHECDFNFLGSFRLTANHTWKKIEEL